MNVAVLNLKELIKLSIRLIALIIGLIVFCFLMSRKVVINDDIFKLSLERCLKTELPYGTIKVKKEDYNIDSKKIIGMTTKILNSSVETAKIEEFTEKKEETKIVQNEITIPTISNIAETEVVQEKNLPESYTNSYGEVKIKNQSNLDLTDEMLIPDVNLENKKELLIFHTHTCESYTSTEEYPYTMTGNYRTTDKNFNMVRVGDELTKHLTEKGFSVVHDTTMHDYPSYTGSYDRSYDTVQNLLYDKNIELVFDLHRDAVGDGLSYGPTVSVNGEKVSQLMFVIGTNGSGLDHPNWVQNLKIAIKIQEKANEMYPRTI